MHVRGKAVEVQLRQFDLTGTTRVKVTCDRCGQMIRYHREVIEGRSVLCKICGDEAYFSNARDIIWPDMNWSPQKTPEKLEVI